MNQIASFAKLGQKSILQEVVVEAVLQLTAESANSSCLGMWNLIAVRLRYYSTGTAFYGNIKHQLQSYSLHHRSPAVELVLDACMCCGDAVMEWYGS